MESQLQAKEASALETYHEAAKVRAKILSYFAEFGSTSNMITKLQPSSPSSHESFIVKSNISKASKQFLQERMLTLQMLPKLDEPKKFDDNPEPINVATIVEEVKNNQHISILEEQRQYLITSIDTAVKKRALDTVRALQQNLDEIEAEIARTNKT